MPNSDEILPLCVIRFFKVIFSSDLIFLFVMVYICVLINLLVCCFDNILNSNFRETCMKICVFFDIQFEVLVHTWIDFRFDIMLKRHIHVHILSLVAYKLGLVCSLL